MKLVLISLIAIMDSSFATVPSSTGATSQLITEIIDEYYVLRQVPLLFASEAKHIQLDLIDEIIPNLRYPRVIQLDPTVCGYSSWSYAIFFLDNYESLKTRISQLNSDRYDLFGYYTFVFYHINKTDILNTFNALWKLKIIRAVLIVVSDDKPQIYNYSPYSQNRCGKPTVQHVQNRASTELFMQHLNDFYSCPLRLGTFQSPPFVNIQSPGPNRPVVVSGFEGDLVTMLSVQLNFNLTVVTPPDNAEWGEARAQNSTGLMGVLQAGLVHFGIGCLGIIPQRNEILQPGRPHYTSRILFAVPDGLAWTSFEKLFRPFQSFVWYSFGGLIGGMAALALFLKFAPDTVRDFIYGKDSRTPFLNFFNIYYTGVLHKLPKRNFARTLLILWILHCFVVRSLYQGLLFKYLQAESNHKPVETINEIEQSDLYYYIFKMSERFFQNNSRVLSRVRLLKPGNDTINVQMDALSTRKLRDGVVLVTLEHLAYHNTLRLEKGFVRCTRDAISSYPMVIYYPKRTFLVRVLNRVIGQIETAGLMEFWVRRYGNYNFFPKMITVGQPTALSSHHLMGCYQSACVLGILACGVFALELVSVKIAILRRFLEFLADK
ncbi:uncharacterized protein LOC135697101 [Ochlerotatus camptorhynchus]|uniref:uncharacterized protein LOC135697101 n=1 Tax=Ochlerotatus camptorhynchus TaxID=644619 RepID=UPI0031D6E87B